MLDFNRSRILRRIHGCFRERRLPIRLARLLRKARYRSWYYKLKLKNAFTRKIKVGFWPITTDEFTLGVRGSRIDPIVDCINAESVTYSADIFFEIEEMANYDIIVIVKEFNTRLYSQIETLKRQGKIFLFDIVDNPFCIYPDSDHYAEHPEFLRLMDGVIASSPLHVADVKPINQNVRLIEHPIINYQYCTYSPKPVVDILWQGHAENLECMSPLHHVLQKIQAETGREIRMIYHTNCEPKEEGMIKYVQWNIFNWQRVLAQADIGIVLKPSDNKWQQRKPSNKVLSYMAAGLPVVCTPTEADKLVIEHGKTGYFAYTEEEWYLYLKKLIESAELREVMGTTAREFVTQQFSVEKITEKYTDFFEGVMSK